MDIRIYNPCMGRTECRGVAIGDITLGFSYNTLITIDSPRVRARLANRWGPTTGRHFTGLGFERGFKDPAIVPDDEFAKIVEQEILGYGLRNMTDVVLHGLPRAA